MFDLHINFSSELTTFPSLVCYIFILNMSHLRRILKKALLTFIGNVVKIHKETPKFLELLIPQSQCPRVRHPYHCSEALYMCVWSDGNQETRS